MLGRVRAVLVSASTDTHSGIDVTSQGGRWQWNLIIGEFTGRLVAKQTLSANPCAYPTYLRQGLDVGVRDTPPLAPVVSKSPP